MTNKINFKDDDTIEILRSSIYAKKQETRKKRRSQENRTELDDARYDYELAHLDVLAAQLQLEWRLSYNKKYNEFLDKIDVKQNRLKIEMCKLEIEKAEQTLVAADADYGRAITNS